MITKKDLRAYQQTDRILLREEDFAYILPHSALRTYISNYTVTFPSEKIISNRYTVIPHGSATLVCSQDKRGICGSLFGPASKTCMVGGLANQSDMLVIIEFQPAGLSAFTNVRQKELADRIISFDDIHPILNGLLLEALECSHDLDGLIHLLDRRLLEQLQTAYPPELQIATSLMVRRNGNISCNELSASVYFSARHLGRIFENHLGLGVKTFSRLVRINKAIRLLQNPQCSVTHASCEAGFYDSSHFIRDFQSVCGMKPQEFRNNMSDFYSEIAKF